MTTVAPGQVVHTTSPTVKKAQEGVLEFLLANHPLDCPVCDKGGECPLQDQAFSHGPGESRFIEEKRHFEKPIPISSLVYLDRERCILCDRCTRFTADVAGDPHLLHQPGNTTQVQTFPTIRSRPTSAATPSRSARRRHGEALPVQGPAVGSRQTESTCTTCSVGCRITVNRARTACCATRASTAIRSTGLVVRRGASPSRPSPRSSG
jgi:NADH-quinone oxidoreductase subunit G